MRVTPTELCEVISVTSAITPRCRSSGVATLDAMFAGLAPGSCAMTWMVGKSTCGSGDTGKGGKRHRARERDAGGQKRGRDRPRDEGSGKVHSAGLGPGACAAPRPVTRRAASSNTR